MNLLSSRSQQLLVRAVPDNLLGNLTDPAVCQPVAFASSRLTTLTDRVRIGLEGTPWCMRWSLDQCRHRNGHFAFLVDST